MLQFKYRLYIQILLVWQFRMPCLHLSWASSAPKLRYFLMIILSSSFCQFYVNIDTMLIFRSIRHSKLLLHIENGLLEWWMNGWMDGSVLRYVYTRDHFKDIADCWMRCRRRQSSGDGKMHYLYIMLFFYYRSFCSIFFV